MEFVDDQQSHLSQYPMLVRNKESSFIGPKFIFRGKSHSDTF